MLQADNKLKIDYLVGNDTKNPGGDDSPNGSRHRPAAKSQLS